ncbi:hypothetical protein PFICI_10605 [Pestalotiopsis fici W106-1]|uniref:Beta-glucuronidase C-terminal domain-containing protein n=1 Tax=Pestalotiopsis fici (strain W106-1 / CGMCC3.15140) TaxID=1229662 RepID=W3WXE2_PESFW|nr:uncharacterized protein PFICI_10605 [Pestalotiopsis fici W106-1]ETS78543.1 hypothetical protein PFICI_10605 [Pestalotiopsis fici W106-1]
MHYSNLSLCLPLLNATTTQAVSLDPATKDDDAPIVPKDFVGFGIENAFLNNYANDFSNNLIASIADRMGAPPVLRVGGTSGDKFSYDPSQTENRICLERNGSDCPNGSDAYYSLGPSFFEGFQSFQSAKINIQAPLNSTVNLTMTLAYVTQAWENVGAERVDAIALGNEPEWYDATAEKYVDDALQIQAAIIDALNLTGDARKIFEASNTASENAGTGNKWKLSDALSAGMNNNGLLKNTAEHYYQVKPPQTWNDATMQARMLNHYTITNRLANYSESIQASKAMGLPYYIDEDAAVLGGAPPQFQSGFGYALWAVDFNLLCMTRGVARVNNLAGRPSASRQFWVPDDSAVDTNTGPQVRAPFPAAAYVADFIGAEGDTAVQEIDLGEDRPYLSAYSAYDNASGALLRLALVNLRLYNGTLGGERGSEDFNVTLPAGVTSVTVRRLHADLGAAAQGFDYAGPTHNVSWAGEQWSYSVDLGKGHYTTGSPVMETINVDDGVATVNVLNSEAVIVYIDGM